jgi:hypothetical protein
MTRIEIDDISDCRIAELSNQLAAAQARIAELESQVGQKKAVMPRPYNGHPPAKHQCGICGGAVSFEGGAPDPQCWPLGKKNGKATNSGPAAEGA